MTLSGEIIVAGHVARVGGCHIIVTAQGRHGWSSFRLTVGDKAWDIGPFGYCTDALGDLVPAALLLATPDYRAEVRSTVNRTSGASSSMRVGTRSYATS